MGRALFPQIVALPPWRLLALLGCLVAGAARGGEAPVHHSLEVSLDPAGHQIQGRDRIQLAQPLSRAEVWLHAELKLSLEGSGRLKVLGSRAGAVPLTRYSLSFDRPSRELVLDYAGRLDHPLAGEITDGGQQTQGSPGLIDDQGVFLAPYSGWYPDLPGRLLSFDLRVHLPEGWHSVSEGRRTVAANGEEHWAEDAPQEGIHLIAARFTEYSRPGTRAEAMVFLRHPDPDLADRYLDATRQYLDLYSSMIGPYPYAKFALVENLWETGYGMPSFTLLGSTVIRLPFIVRTSYPHEILHNWWGNGVYVDNTGGNWSEGLTAYLADQLLAERRGEGESYRRDSLRKYADYVSQARDFPLAEFHMRHGEASQAVGYDKGLMFFHMLRKRLGDPVFFAALRRFYQDHRFTEAGFADLRAAFEAESGQDLASDFKQWVQRSGAPRIELAGMPRVEGASGHGLSFGLRQTQAEPPFQVRVPVRVELKGAERPVHRTLVLNGREQTYQLDLPARPARLEVDPDFDVFRRLLPGEVPTSVSSLLGAEDVWAVLPGRAPPALREAYRGLAEAWTHGRQLHLVTDDAVGPIPTGSALWLFGWENRRLSDLVAAAGGRVRDLSASGLSLDGRRVDRRGHALVLTLGARAGGALGWVGLDDPGAAAALARKVPHYGKYTCLVFEGPEATNLLKGQWPADASPLAVDVP